MNSHIRIAQFGDIDAMRAIERAAGELFAHIGMEDIAAHPPLDAAVLADYIAGGRAWVAEVDGRPVGYAIADIVDGRGHLEQVSVDPASGRQGLGRRLIGAVVEWTRAQGFSALTLVTFRDVAWNAPYYVSLGFRPLPDGHPTPELRALRDHESELGLDRDARIAMILPLPSA